MVLLEDHSIRRMINPHDASSVGTHLVERLFDCENGILGEDVIGRECGLEIVDGQAFNIFCFILDSVHGGRDLYGHSESADDEYGPTMMCFQLEILEGDLPSVNELASNYVLET